MSAGPVEGVGGLCSPILQSRLTPRGSQRGPGPRLWRDIRESREVFLLLCVLDLSFPTCGIRQLDDPRTHFPLLPQQVKGSPRGASKRKTNEGGPSSGLGPPVGPDGRDSTETTRKPRAWRSRSPEPGMAHVGPCRHLGAPHTLDGEPGSS